MAFGLVTVSSSHVYILSPATVCVCLVSQPKGLLNRVFTSDFRATRNAGGSCLPFEVANIFFNAWEFLDGKLVAPLDISPDRKELILFFDVVLWSPLCFPT